MPQTLLCYKCGAQNIMGMRFCTACGERFLYKCPKCGTNIEPGFGYCSGCSARLDWGTETEKTAHTNFEQTKLAEFEQAEEKETVRSKNRGLSLWLIAFIIVVILIGAIFAIDAMF